MPNFGINTINLLCLKVILTDHNCCLLFLLAIHFMRKKTKTHKRKKTQKSKPKSWGFVSSRFFENFTYFVCVGMKYTSTFRLLLSLSQVNFTQSCSFHRCSHTMVHYLMVHLPGRGGKLGIMTVTTVASHTRYKELFSLHCNDKLEHQSISESLI